MISMSDRGNTPTVNPVLAPARFPGLFLFMNSDAILLMEEPFGASNQNKPAPNNRVLVADDGISIRELSSKVSTDCGCPVNTITISKEILRVVGLAELTAANCNQVRKKVCSVLNGHSVIEVDLSQTAFIDCAGVGALIAVRNQTHGRKGVVRLLNPAAPVEQLLDFMRAGQIFEIVHSPEGEPVVVDEPRPTEILPDAVELQVVSLNGGK